MLVRGEHWCDLAKQLNNLCMAEVQAVVTITHDLVDELVLHKNGKLRNNNYLHTVLNSVILLCTKYYQNW